MKKLLSKFNKHSSLLWKQLPLYIKIFSVYFFASAVIELTYLTGSFFNLFPTVGVRLYGLYSPSATTSLGILLIAIYLYKGFLGYSLYKGKNFSVLLAYIDAILGIALWLFMALEPVFLHQLVVPHVLSFYILFLIPYALIMGRLLFFNENLAA